ncbi:MAG: MarR family winged helix-turn-helix transcriptional regulator [Dehalococcoidia bacterium]
MVEPHRHSEDQPRLIGALLRVPSDEVRRRVALALSDVQPGLTFSHMPVFQQIDHPPDGTRQTDLAARIGISKQALGDLVDAMEGWGLVERISDPDDRRAKFVRLTPAGWDVHELASEVVRGIEDEWAKLMGPSDFDELRRLLGILNARLALDIHA